MRILIVLRRVLVRAFSMAVVRVLSDEKHWLCLLYRAMLSRRYRHHGACKRSSIEICHFAPCETNLQHHDFMYSQLPKSWRNPKNLEISLGEGFCGSRGDAAFSLCLG